MKIDILKETFEITHHKIVRWPKEKILFCADLHLGREIVHQKKGFRLPYGAMEKDLERLKSLIHQEERLIIVGDFIHHGIALTDSIVEIIEKWIDGLSIQVDLVIGNHDRALRKKLPSSWKLSIQDELEIGQFLFCHEPQTREKFVWAGHVHPMFHISHGSESIRLPCYYIENKYGIIPAFGSMTGGHLMKSSSTSQIYVVTDQRVRSMIAAPATNRKAIAKPSPKKGTARSL